MFFCEDAYQKLRDQIRIAFVVYDGYFKNDRNICSLIVDDFEGGREAGHYFASIIVIKCFVSQIAGLSLTVIGTKDCTMASAPGRLSSNRYEKGRKNALLTK